MIKFYWVPKLYSILEIVKYNTTIVGDIMNPKLNIVCPRKLETDLENFVEIELV